MLLEVRRFGLVAEGAVARAVGDQYTDNTVLATLALLEEGPSRPRDLSVALDIPTPSISRVIDTLEASGDVLRQADRVAEDERAVLVTLTRRGRRRGRTVASAVLATATDLAPTMLEAARLLNDISVSPDAQAAPPAVSPTGLTLAIGRLGIRLSRVVREPLYDLAGTLALCAIVVDGGESRPTRIGNHVGLTSGGTTKALDRLESAGLIERTFGTRSDRRAVVVTMTASGAHQLDLMVEQLEPHLLSLRQLFVSVCDQLEPPGS